MKPLRFDHDNLAMGCDPNIFDAENQFSFLNGAYSIFRRSLYGKEMHDYTFEWSL